MTATEPTARKPGGVNLLSRGQPVGGSAKVVDSDREARRMLGWQRQALHCRGLVVDTVIVITTIKLNAAIDGNHQSEGMA